MRVVKKWEIARVCLGDENLRDDLKGSARWSRCGGEYCSGVGVCACALSCVMAYRHQINKCMRAGWSGPSVSSKSTGLRERLLFTLLLWGSYLQVHFSPGSRNDRVALLCYCWWNFGFTCTVKFPWCILRAMVWFHMLAYCFLMQEHTYSVLKCFSDLLNSQKHLRDARNLDQSLGN